MTMPVRKLRPLVNPRRLRALKIAEVSLVNAGAGIGTEILLAKRKDTSMQIIDIDINKAGAMFNLLCDLERAKDPKLTASTAINKVLATDTGREALELSLQANRAANSVDKSVHDGRDQDSLDGAGEPWTADATLARMRREHGRKALSRFNGIVDAHVAGGMRRSDAQSRAIRENPTMWQEAKGARMEPLSHDGNSLRP